jgi:cytochrome P450 / NADPH-cytochrome P450 reductase
MLQTFDFRFDDPSYQLQIKQTLTIKPKGFFMHATLRDHIDPVHLERMLHVDISNQTKRSDKEKSIVRSAAIEPKEKTPMTILYGSNSGTCEALAQSLARVAGARGFRVRVDTLDSATGKVPKGETLVMISSSYEGQPPDNAAHFVNWLSSLEGQKMLDGVNYAVYGCGNRTSQKSSYYSIRTNINLDDWASTFHRVPIFLDTAFTANGAHRISNIGLGDVAAGDIFNDFDKWQDEDFWPALGPISEDDGDVGIELVVDTSSRRSKLRQDVKEAIVVSNEVLTATGELEKRHIVLKLPTGMTYKTGDYLAVLPINDSKNIHRVLKRFSLPWDAVLTIRSGSNTTLPTEHPLSATDVLAAYVELSQPATRRVRTVNLMPSWSIKSHEWLLFSA